jgi:hypothetical protein
MIVKMYLLIIVDKKKVKIYLSVFSFFFFVLSHLSFLLLSRLEDAAHEGPLQQAGFQGSLLEWALEKKRRRRKRRRKKNEMTIVTYSSTYEEPLVMLKG